MTKASAGEAKSLPQGWNKIPWTTGISPYKPGVMEPHNPNRDVPMFEVGDILQTRWKGKKRTMQVVDRMRGKEKPFDEYWYCVTRGYGKNAMWFKESDFNRYTIMRKWRPDMRKKYLDPFIIRKTFSKGVRLSIVFDYGKPEEQMFYGIITKKRQKKITFYTIKFNDNTKMKVNQYRLLWLLDQTARFLERLPVARVGKEYTGGDIPIALPGLKLRF